MAKKKVIHMYTREDIVRSVLKGHKVISQCGHVTTHTRASVDDTPGWIESGVAKICTKCFSSVDSADSDVTIHPPRGWLDLLERAWVSQYDAAANSTRYTIRSTGSYPYAA